jgi:CRP/FNR family transcriptional regulator, cyclic AMP receptor protein
MIDAEPSLQAAEAITGSAMITYLARKGWRQRPSRIGGILIVSKELQASDHPVEFIVPIEQGIDDDRRRLADALRTLAVLEGRSEAQIAEEIQAETPSGGQQISGGPHRAEARVRASKAQTAGPAIERARKLLGGHVVFRALDERERLDLAAQSEIRSFAADEPIFHIGEAGDSMMGVVKGTARISLPTPKGREMILADLPAGEFFGEIAMLDGKPHSANATALTNCELLVVERRNVLSVLERRPKAWLNLMQLLCAQIRRADERMVEIAFFDLPARLARVLLRYPAQGSAPPRVSLSQRELAEMSGSTRENVNRCLRDWQRQGILELKDRWTVIRKPEILRELAEYNRPRTFHALAEYS